MSTPATRLSQAQYNADRIRHFAQLTVDAVEGLRQAVYEAEAQRHWEVLGFESLRSYLSATLTPVRGLDRADREKLVLALDGAGLTSREIAPLVGASFKTVTRDLNPQLRHDPPRSVQNMDAPDAVGLSIPMTLEEATERLSILDGEIATLRAAMEILERNGVGA